MHPNIWQPFTILKGAPESARVIEGEGIWLTLEDGRRVVDCISSWWVNLHGHSHPYIADAIHRQAGKLEHVIFANYSHEPAERLAERLVDRLPRRLERLFFSDNGSTAMEVALKMAWQYWINRGRKRKRFIAFEGGYHGDTIGAMSAGGRSVFTQIFGELMFRVDYLPYPDTWLGDESVASREDAVLDLLGEKLRTRPDDYAAVVIEPLIQGVAGMKMCRPNFLQKLERLCRSNDVLLIFDEVMTGFGRTGEWFAATKSRVEPDIIALAKGITGGFLPLAVTVCSDRIYRGFQTDDPLATFWHGHSYTANPLGCAAALASMDLLERDEDAFRRMGELHLELIEPVRTLPFVEKVRVQGAVAAFSVRTGEADGYLNRIAGQIKERCTDFDLLLRPLGNVVYLMPPYCITRRELEMVYKKVRMLLREVVSE